MTTKGYQLGLVCCSNCRVFLHPINDKDKIYVSPASGQTYHDKKYCPVESPYPSRLRVKPKSKRSRLERQARATYY